VSRGSSSLGSRGEALSIRDCEEHLRRSNPESLRGKILDCFATLAMTEQATPLAAVSDRA
jgi:hypothetical protein